MSAAWDLDIPSTEKMVLMCLCDYANDEGGNCWPSVATLARKCSKSARTIQGAIQWLAKHRFLTTKDAPGKSHSFTLDPRKICAPAETAPPQKTAQTPASSAPNPSGTTNEGLAIAKPTRAKGWPPIPEWVPVEQWNGYIEMRRRQRASPTPRAVGLLIGKLGRWRDKGHDPGEILDASTERNWTGIFEPKEQLNGQPHHKIQRSGGEGVDRRSSLARAIDEGLANLE